MVTTQLLARFEACIVMHAVGDSIAFNRGKWRYKFDSRDLWDELNELGDIEKLVIGPKKWILSSNTILNLATAECLIETSKTDANDLFIYSTLINCFKKAMEDMNTRLPDQTTIANIGKLNTKKINSYRKAYNKKDICSDAAVRSVCIGLRYSKPEQKRELIEFAVESSRMTHHHPIGYLGGVLCALMVSYAIQDKPIAHWGLQALLDLDIARDYVKSSNHCVEENLNDWKTVVEPFSAFLKARSLDKVNLADAKSNESAQFPDKYGIEERDAFYKTIMGNKWPGSNGIDSVLIAYDALLGCNGDWRELCHRAMIHGGDNDSTGCIAGAFYGAINGFSGVNANNYEHIEYHDRLFSVGKELYEIQYGSN